MSKEIDWSKAPEGATHYLPAKDENCHDLWLRMDEGYVIQVGYTEPGCTDWVFYYTKEKQPNLDTSMAIPCKPRWNDTGLPPVGTVCEVLWNESRMEYLKTKVFGVNEHGQPIHRFDEGPKKFQYQADPLFTITGVQVFRPIRTQAQIEAEERDKAVSDMLSMWMDCGSARDFCEYLYDHGYRKTEAAK